jgi:hypothetical protein
MSLYSNCSVISYRKFYENLRFLHISRICSSGDEPVINIEVIGYVLVDSGSIPDTASNIP